MLEKLLVYRAAKILLNRGVDWLARGQVNDCTQLSAGGTTCRGSCFLAQNPPPLLRSQDVDPDLFHRQGCDDNLGRTISPADYEVERVGCNIKCAHVVGDSGAIAA
jgi:hypothetical protein